VRHHILVGTNHKTGTHWMRKVFTHLAGLLSVRFHDLSYSSGFRSDEAKCRAFEDAVRGGARAIIFENHSCFPFLTADVASDCRGIHMIRDPRDVIISSAKYHEWSHEDWLHVSRPDFDGRTYQEQIRSLASFRDKLIFEMAHSAGTNIRAMTEFDGGGCLVDVKYESLITDTEMRVWQEICVTLGLEAHEMESAKIAFWEHSLFGNARRTAHVQSGRSEQWRQHFDDGLYAELDRRFPGCLERLCYPRN
jgi:hypothetical protein